VSCPALIDSARLAVMPRRLLLILLLLLSSSILGGTCSEAVPLEELQKDTAPAFDYALYCDKHGTLTGARSGVLLVHRTEHLERVYADSLDGDPRAQALVRQLEDTLRETGRNLAAAAEGLACSSLPACVVQWNHLDEFIPSHGPGGMHLREMLADGFTAGTKTAHVSNTVLSAVLDVLLVGTTLKAGVANAEGKAAMAEARAGAADAQARPIAAGQLALAGLEVPLAAEELPALEARLAAEEALETAARHPARLEELARKRPLSSQPPSGVDAGSPRWTSYVAYWHRRYDELAGTRPLPSRLLEARPPLTWSSYSSLLNRFQRSLDFQRGVTRELQQQASASATSREWLPGMKEPLITDNTGLKIQGRATPVYVDQLAVDKATLGPGRQPSVHTFSNKQRSFAGKSPQEALKQLELDAAEARTKYGGEIEVRRPAHPLFGKTVRVSQTHIVYDGVGLSPELKKALLNDAPRLGVKLHFHVP
jgi:hypothetical protein